MLRVTQRWSQEHKARGQGHKKISRPRTDPLEAKDQGHRRKISQKKKVFKNLFSGKKGLQKIFFRRSLLEETKKKVFADFPQGFWRFPTKFQRFKNSAVVEPKTGNFRGLEASRPRTSKCVLEAKNVVEDSTSGVTVIQKQETTKTINRNFCCLSGKLKRYCYLE